MPEVLCSIPSPQSRGVGERGLKKKKNLERNKSSLSGWLFWEGGRDCLRDKQLPPSQVQKAFNAVGIPSQEHQGATCISSVSRRLGAPLQELLAQSLELSVVKNAL